MGYSIKQEGKNVGTVCTFMMGKEPKTVSLTGEVIKRVVEKKGVKVSADIKPPTQEELKYMHSIGIKCVIKDEKEEKPTK